ncbi:MAG: toll/interleukin-1 receptor domain-containing protein [Candidatus Aminicenantes bacterium]|nr:MAG: toll/interleukin-1 receptor domain-containing protein [Candidatus Aminicenantes bacterium]
MDNKHRFQPPPQKNHKSYHAFISHKNDCKSWVKILAENLKAQGFKVFLDEWEIKPGENWLENIYRGLNKSQKGILVITPNAMDSGWVRKEYEEMLILMQEDPGFQIIPVVLTKPVPGFPFLKTIRWIDFSEPGSYKQAFYSLVCALEDKPPGPVPTFKTEPEIPGQPPKSPPGPGPDEIDFVDGLFKLLFDRNVLVLLTRGNPSQAGAKELILEKAGRLFGPDNVRHLAPAYGPHVDMREYFSLLSQQCRFSPPAQSAVSFQAKFEELLADDHEIFLLISRFEHSSRETREELAALLRSLGERFPRGLRAVICGGEQLYELSYTGTLSYLNQAQIIEWPEMTDADVLRTANTSENSTCLAGKLMQKIDEDTAVKFLEFSGGHPDVLDTCFDLYSQNPGFTMKDLIEKLVSSSFLWQLFVPFFQDSEKKEKIRLLLKNNHVGPYQPYLDDPLLKELYWKNLLHKDKTGARLTWRGQALRLSALNIMR